MMKSLLPAIFSLLLIAGCGKSGNIKISGDYNGEKRDNLFLIRVDVDVPVLIDSVRINRSGKFSIRFNSEMPEFYNLGFDNYEFITLIAHPGDNIIVDFKGRQLQDDYTVSGSPDSEKVRTLDKKLTETIGKLDSLRNYYKTAGDAPGFDTLGPALDKEYERVINEQRRNNIAFILDNLSSFASIKAIYQRIDEETYVLYQEKDLQYLKLVSDSLTKYYPESKQTMALASNLGNEINAMYMRRITALAGETQPTDIDADLPDLDGKMVKLSSIRKSNWVLISFWSAESKECVANNLQMKEFYKIYHREGFEIYQVNLDPNEDLWRGAVTFDDLPWISVRDNEDGVSYTARLFNVTSVPSNYLMNPDGELVARDLFGKALQIKLSQIFD